MAKKLRFLFTLLFVMAAGSIYAQKDMSAVYTSNVELSTSGGTSASECVVKISNADYNGLKAGSGKTAGAVQITVPKGTKYLHLHAAGWSNETVKLSVTPSGYSDAILLESNSGISNNTPFTFDGDANTSDYYKVITFATALTDDTKLTFTATSGNRFVVFGVYAEEEESKPKHKVEFYQNGDKLSEAEVEETKTILFPTAEEEILDKKFVGWLPAEIEGTTNEASPVNSAVMGTADVAYYAVYANVEGEEKTATLTANERFGTAYQEKTFIDNLGNTWSAKCNSTASNSTAVMVYGLNSGDKNPYIDSPTFGGNITSVKVVSYNGSSTKNRTFYLKNGETQVGKVSVPKSTTGVELSAELNSVSFNQFTMTASDALQFSSISVTYGQATYSDYCTTVVEPVAQIGDVKYETLAAALAAAEEDATIEVIKAGDYKLPNLPKNVTIEGKAEGVVFNGDVPEKTSIASIANGATFKNVTFNMGQNNYHGFQHAGTINMEGCTLNGKFFSYGDMNFTNCQFVQDAEDYHMWVYGKGTVNYTSCTFTGKGKFLNLYSESSDNVGKVTFTDCKFINLNSAANKAAINVKATCGSTLLKYDVTIKNCTTEGAFPEANVTQPLAILNGLVQVDDRTANGVDNITVTQDGEQIYPIKNYVAQIGDVKYETLKEALDAAKDNESIVVELLADAELDIRAWAEGKNPLAIGSINTKTITINGNNHKLTFNQENSDWNNVSTMNDAETKLVLNDMKITNAGYNNSAWNRHDINFNCAVELNNVTSDKALAFKNDATLKNVTINDNGSNSVDNKISEYYGIWISPRKAGQNISIDGLTVTCARGIKVDDEYVDNPEKVTLDIKNATFNTTKKAAILVKSKAETAITVGKGVNIENVAADKVNTVWVDEDYADEFYKVAVEGATMVPESKEADYDACLMKGDQRWGFYKKVSSAIEKVEDGYSIKLFRTTTEAVTVEKTLTIMKNGFTAENVVAGEGFVRIETDTEIKIISASAVPTTPVVFHDSGEYEDGLSVPMYAQAGEIYYTINDGTKTKYTAPLTIKEDTKITAWAEINGVESDKVTKTFTIVTKADAPSVEEGYYSIKNGTGKYINVAGRKTVTFTDAIDDKAGTVLKVKTGENGQVEVLRSQGVDLPGYADRAMNYVPKFVKLIVDKLHAEGSGEILGENGLDAIMKKFNESFDYHLYIENANENDNAGYRIYGKTPSMKPVVDFYAENKANVDYKLPQLEAFINSAIQKVLQKTGGRGASILTDFKLHDIWQKMGETLTEPTDEVTTAKFYEEVLASEANVWNFAYQTAMIYWNNVKNHPRYEELKGKLGEYAKYIEKVENIRPNFKYYIVANEAGNDVDFISEGNADINAARATWTLEKRTDFKVTFNKENSINLGRELYTTLYTDFAYTVPEKVKAYKVTAIDEKTGLATKEEITGVIPAQTPVLLQMIVDPKTVTDADLTQTLSLSTEAGTAVTGNLLQGPEWLINKYQIKAKQVEELFGYVHDFLKLADVEALYDSYVKEYEYLMIRNAGTVNNKYFFGLSGDDIAEAENVCQLAKQGDTRKRLAFYYNLEKVEANKAFIPSEKVEPVYLSLIGDVNRDGSVDIEDVTCQINIVLGKDKPSDNYDYDAADLDSDEDVLINDVTDLIDVVLGKKTIE